MQEYRHRRAFLMFTDSQLEKIFSKPELQRLPLETQSEVIHAIEDALEEVDNDVSE